MADTMTQQTIKEAKVEYIANAIATIPPGTLPEQLEDEESIKFYQETASLTVNQRRVLIALCENVVAEDTKTDGEIAEDLGLHYQTISQCRRNPKFGRVLAAITIDLVRGLTDKAILNLSNLALKDTKANEILLRIAEVYVPASKQLNVHANVSRETLSGSGEANIEDVLIEWGAKGLSIKWIAEKWAQLKSEGAF